MTITVHVASDCFRATVPTSHTLSSFVSYLATTTAQLYASFSVVLRTHEGQKNSELAHEMMRSVTAIETSRAVLTDLLAKLGRLKELRREIAAGLSSSTVSPMHQKFTTTATTMASPSYSALFAGAGGMMHDHSMMGVADDVYAFEGDFRGILQVTGGLYSDLSESLRSFAPDEPHSSLWYFMNEKAIRKRIVPPTRKLEGIAVLLELCTQICARLQLNLQPIPIPITNPASSASAVAAGAGAVGASGNLASSGTEIAYSYAHVDLDAPFAFGEPSRVDVIMPRIHLAEHLATPGLHYDGKLRSVMELLVQVTAACASSHHAKNSFTRSSLWSFSNMYYALMPQKKAAEKVVEFFKHVAVPSGRAVWDLTDLNTMVRAVTMISNPSIKTSICFSIPHQHGSKSYRRQSMCASDMSSRLQEEDHLMDGNDEMDDVESRDGGRSIGSNSNSNSNRRRRITGAGRMTTSGGSMSAYEEEDYAADEAEELRDENGAAVEDEEEEDDGYFTPPHSPLRKSVFQESFPPLPQAYRDLPSSSKRIFLRLVSPFKHTRLGLQKSWIGSTEKTWAATHGSEVIIPITAPNSAASAGGVGTLIMQHLNCMAPAADALGDVTDDESSASMRRDYISSSTDRDESVSDLAQAGAQQLDPAHKAHLKTHVERAPGVSSSSPVSPTTATAASTSTTTTSPSPSNTTTHQDRGRHATAGANSGFSSAATSPNQRKSRSMSKKAGDADDEFLDAVSYAQVPEHGDPLDGGRETDEETSHSVRPQLSGSSQSSSSASSFPPLSAGSMNGSAGTSIGGHKHQHQHAASSSLQNQQHHSASSHPLRPVPMGMLPRSSSSLYEINRSDSELSFRVPHPSQKQHVYESDFLIVHIHGGGFISMSSFSHECYTRSWANLSSAPVVSIDYRVAPEYPYPVPVDECFCAYKWIVSHAHKLNSKARRIVLCGDSAGGNLACCVVLRCIAEGIRVPDALVLSYPAMLLTDTPSAARVMSMMDPMVNSAFLVLCQQSYMKEMPLSERMKPYCSPFACDDASLSRFPRTLIHCGSCDPLFDDSLALWRRMERLGCNVHFDVVDGLGHGHLNLQSQIPESKKAVIRIGEWIRSVFQESISDVASSASSMSNVELQQLRPQQRINTSGANGGSNSKPVPSLLKNKKLDFDVQQQPRARYPGLVSSDGEAENSADETDAHITRRLVEEAALRLGSSSSLKDSPV
eukprot:ANDGO_00927.mRNA.1 Esterase